VLKGCRFRSAEDVTVAVMQWSQQWPSGSTHMGIVFNSLYFFAHNNPQTSKLQRLACLGITGAMRMAPTAAIEVLLGLFI
jgi:hypothetical protein